MRSITAAMLFAATCFAVAQAAPEPAAAVDSSAMEARIAELEATVDLLEDVALDQQAELRALKAEAEPPMTMAVRSCAGADGIC